MLSNVLTKLRPIREIVIGFAITGAIFYSIPISGAAHMSPLLFHCLALLLFPSLSLFLSAAADRAHRLLSSAVDFLLHPF